MKLYAHLEKNPTKIGHIEYGSRVHYVNGGGVAWCGDKLTAASG